MGKSKKTKAKSTKPKFAFIAASVLVVAAVIVGIVLLGTRNSREDVAAAETTAPASAKNSAAVKEETSSVPAKNVLIDKSKITDEITFIPYQAGDVKMELMAVKASDGTIRTAFNTCQVCYDSGRGYYKQSGDEAVCQNCGNRFKISQIEKVKNGCNPVPVTAENKTEDDTNITISGTFLVSYKDMFLDWKR